VKAHILKYNINTLDNSVVRAY